MQPWSPKYHEAFVHICKKRLMTHAGVHDDMGCPHIMRWTISFFLNVIGAQTVMYHVLALTMCIPTRRPDFKYHDEGHLFLPNNCVLVKRVHVQAWYMYFADNNLWPSYMGVLSRECPFQRGSPVLWCCLTSVLRWKKKVPQSGFEFWPIVAD